MGFSTSQRAARRTALATGVALAVGAAFAFGVATADGSTLVADNRQRTAAEPAATSPTVARPAVTGSTSAGNITTAPTTASTPRISNSSTTTTTATTTTVAPPKPTAEMAPPPTASRRPAIVQPVPASTTTIVAPATPPPAPPAPSPGAGPAADAPQPPAATATGNRLIIDRLGFNKRIVNDAWSQASIDRGNVVLWNGCWPGNGCPVWIAGHRSSHGSVFARMVDLQTGDIITVVRNGVTHRYRIYGRQLVSRTSPPGDAIQGDVIIQTSWTNGRVWMIYGTAL